jgi:hypothetical protein
VLFIELLREGGLDDRLIGVVLETMHDVCHSCYCNYIQCYCMADD